MRDVRNQGFVATLRSSPRKRRHFAWLMGGIVVLAMLVAVVVIVPGTGGDPKLTAGELPDDRPTGTGPFWWVATILFIFFLLTLVLGLIRFIWRLSVDDADEGAGSDGYTWRNSRKDLEDAMRSSSE